MVGKRNAGDADKTADQRRIRIIEFNLFLSALIRGL